MVTRESQKDKPQALKASAVRRALPPVSALSLPSTLTNNSPGSLSIVLGQPAVHVLLVGLDCVRNGRPISLMPLLQSLPRDRRPSDPPNSSKPKSGKRQGGQSKPKASGLTCYSTAEDNFIHPLSLLLQRDSWTLREEGLDSPPAGYSTLWEKRSFRIWDFFQLAVKYWFPIGTPSNWLSPKSMLKVHIIFSVYASIKQAGDFAESRFSSFPILCGWHLMSFWVTQCLLTLLNLLNCPGW